MARPGREAPFGWKFFPCPCFPVRMGVEGLKIIADPDLAGDSLLLRDGPQALMARGGALSGFAMR